MNRCITHIYIYTYTYLHAHIYIYILIYTCVVLVGPSYVVMKTGSAHICLSRVQPTQPRKGLNLAFPKKSSPCFRESVMSFSSATLKSLQCLTDHLFCGKNTLGVSSSPTEKFASFQGFRLNPTPDACGKGCPTCTLHLSTGELAAEGFLPPGGPRAAPHVEDDLPLQAGAQRLGRGRPGPVSPCAASAVESDPSKRLERVHAPLPALGRARIALPAKAS